MPRAHMKSIVALVLRAVLWVLFIVAPGGVFLLPLLVGDAVARRKRAAAQNPVDAASSVQMGSTVDPPLAAPASGH